MQDRQTTPPSFESALAEFEALVERMERGDLSLEESVNAYERGVVLHRYCEEALTTAERKLQVLAEGSGPDGAGEALRAFETEAGDSRPPRRGEPSSPPRDTARAGSAPRDDEGDGLPF